MCLAERAMRFRPPSCCLHDGALEPASSPIWDVPMIINHKYKFIFIKTRKTAGTSIEIALSEFCGKGDVITPIGQIEDESKRRQMGFIGPQNYLVPLRFHPMKSWPRRLINGKRRRFYNHSGAAHVKKYIGRSIWDSYFKFCFERNPFDKVISQYYWDKHYRNIDQEINDYVMNVGEDFLSDWNIYAIEDKLAVDCVGSYENVIGDLAAIAEKLKLPKSIELPKAKAAFRLNRSHYSEVLDAQSRARIERVCAKEIEAFNYPWQQSEAWPQVQL
jgi:hypothetical protein